MKATEELAGLCNIGKDKQVLDVGCGVGASACRIAKRLGCRVSGIDLSEKMVGHAKERARREGVEERVRFMVADARKLPFKSESFDAVICESVSAFLEDKQGAVREYARVVKPGGYVGLNEATWMKKPPKELVECLSDIFGAKTEMLDSDGWRALLEGAGLGEITVRVYRIGALSQFINELRLYGLRYYLRAWLRFFSLLIRRPDFMGYMWAKARTPSIWSIFEYLGYGIYVGRK